MSEKKIAVVTGGSAGIGEAAARALADDGYTVYVCARRKELCEKIAGEIGGVGVELDVTDQGSVDKLVELTHSRHLRRPRVRSTSSRSSGATRRSRPPTQH